MTYLKYSMQNLIFIVGPLHEVKFELLLCTILQDKKYLMNLEHLSIVFFVFQDLCDVGDTFNNMLFTETQHFL